jgi:NDP-sugar pyrophosphorylase family protein
MNYNQMNLKAFVEKFDEIFPDKEETQPWMLVRQIEELLSAQLKFLDHNEFVINNNVAIHKTAIVEQGVIIKGMAVISANCFIGAHAYLRGGIFLGEKVSIGPGCEIKSSVIFDSSALAHFNFVGDSILGSHVNMEAGSIIANHHNDRDDKEIFVTINQKKIKTGITKFGALVGDHVKIGANAVLSPGTVLTPESIVKRLELINQNP